MLKNQTGAPPERSSGRSRTPVLVTASAVNGGGGASRLALANRLTAAAPAASTVVGGAAPLPIAAASQPVAGPKAAAKPTKPKRKAGPAAASSTEEADTAPVDARAKPKREHRSIKKRSKIEPQAAAAADDDDPDADAAPIERRAAEKAAAKRKADPSPEIGGDDSAYSGDEGAMDDVGPSSRVLKKKSPAGAAASRASDKSSKAAEVQAKKPERKKAMLSKSSGGATAAAASPAAAAAAADDGLEETLALHGVSPDSKARPTAAVQIPSSSAEGKGVKGGKRDMVVNLAPDLLKSAAARGVEATQPENQTSLPEQLDYDGFRARQVLHHHTEVLRWHLEQVLNPKANADAAEIYRKRQARYDAEQAPARAGKPLPKRPAKEPEDPSGDLKYNPVEVQASYLHREDGSVHLAVSANQQASQAYLSAMTQAQLSAIYAAAAALPADHDVGRAARKVINIRNQNAARLEIGLEHEDPKDLALAERLAGMAQQRDQYTAVVNTAEDADDSGARHAEQNLAGHYIDAMRAADGDTVKYAGTRIRCGACSSHEHLGYDDDLRQLAQNEEIRVAAKEKRNPKLIAFQTMGNYYTGNMTIANARRTVGDLGQGYVKMDSRSYRRPRSRSPVRMPKAASSAAAAAAGGSSSAAAAAPKTTKAAAKVAATSLKTTTKAKPPAAAAAAAASSWGAAAEYDDE